MNVTRVIEKISSGVNELNTSEHMNVFETKKYAAIPEKLGYFVPV